MKMRVVYLHARVWISLKTRSHVRMFATPWTIVCQAPLSMGVSRQPYWSGLPCSSPGDFSDPGMEPMKPALAGRFFTTEPPGKPCCCCCYVTSVGSDSVWPHRRQPTRLPRPWDSPRTLEWVAISCSNPWKWSHSVMSKQCSIFWPGLWLFSGHLSLVFIKLFLPIFPHFYQQKITENHNWKRETQSDPSPGPEFSSEEVKVFFPPA